MHVLWQRGEPTVFISFCSGCIDNRQAHPDRRSQFRWCD